MKLSSYSTKTLNCNFKWVLFSKVFLLDLNYYGSFLFYYCGNKYWWNFHSIFCHPSIVCSYVFSCVATLNRRVRCFLFNGISVEAIDNHFSKALNLYFSPVRTGLILNGISFLLRIGRFIVYFADLMSITLYSHSNLFFWNFIHREKNK